MNGLPGTIVENVKFSVGKRIAAMGGECVRGEVSQYPHCISFDQGRLRYTTMTHKSPMCSAAGRPM